MPPSSYRTDPAMASRTYALLGIAQDRAVAAALARATSSPRPLDHAAAVSASSAILKSAYPQETQMLDSIARGDLADPLWSADALVSVAEGEAVGLTSAQQLLAERANDGSAAVWSGTVPTGTGMGYSSAVPAAAPLRPLWGSVTPWLMTRGDQFRPEAPPAVGSAAYNLTEAEAAHVLAVLNMAMMDAGIAVWDAKYVYWLIRPSQVDPTITTPIGLPNFPSYVSGHSGFSGAAADILRYFFPNEAANLRAQAEEAAVSRLYGGIHYRFDSEVGLRMGRAIAALGVARERSRGTAVFRTGLAAGLHCCAIPSVSEQSVGAR